MNMFAIVMKMWSVEGKARTVADVNEDVNEQTGQAGNVQCL